MGAFLIGYFAFLLIAHCTYGDAWGWKHLGAPPMSPSFGDLRNITSAVDCQADGYDPLVSDPCDPWHRPMNYPRLWVALFSALHLHQRETTILGIGLVVAFYLSVFLFVGTINAYEGAIYSVLLCSPAAMMGINRGNNDLVIFILLALALLLLRQAGGIRWLCYVLVGVCAVLKLYPFAAYVLALREKPRAAAAILGISTLLFAAYVVHIRQDVRAINAALPRSDVMAYGRMVLFDRLQTTHLARYVKPISMGAVVCAVIAAGMIRYKMPPILLSRWNRDSLWVGAILYVITFAFGNNYNYRLIFLLFAVPALLELVKNTGVQARFAGFLLTVMMLSLWMSMAEQRVWFVVKELGNWTLFSGLLAMLFHQVHALGPKTAEPLAARQLAAR